MLDLAGGTTVYLVCGVTDLRKSYNGLAAIIKLKFYLDPYSRCMFFFATAGALLSRFFSGADASSITYSIVETALLNGLKPYLYLTYVLERLRQLGPFPKPEELDSLLPCSEDLPEEIKTKTKPKK